MKVLCLVPDANSPGKKDVTGAFHPEAVAFCKHHGVNPVKAITRFPTKGSLAARRTVCARAIAASAGLDVIACFCHGWRNGIQAGWQLPTVRALASLCSAAMVESGHILLYACDAGRDADVDQADDVEEGPGGDGGFADELRDACETLGRRITVAAHATTGHSTYNPHVRIFAPGEHGRGGRWVIAPGTRLWPRWVLALRDPDGTLRYRFWGMSYEAIAAELEPTRGPLVA